MERIAIPETDLPDLSGAVADYATFWPEGFDPEDARHWYGTQLFAVGTDLPTIRDQMGHASGGNRTLVGHFLDNLTSEAEAKVAQIRMVTSAPGRIRTSDLRNRSPLL